MPSFRSLAGFALSALGGGQSVLGLKSPLARQSGFDIGASATCSNPQLSCHNTSAVEDLCCFNSPGGALLQTQFWDTDPATGPSDSWTVHGLWPDNCDGTYDANCDDSRAYTNISAILKAFNRQDLLDYMNKYWVSDQGSAESFWEHEWGKHGTCISTLKPSCYSDYQATEEVPDFFNRTVALFKSLPTYQWLSDAGITPSTSQTYSASDIQAALSKNRDGHEAYLGCSGSTLEEVWYFYNVAGSVQTGDFEPADLVGSASTCPSSGIKYLPKSGSGSTSTATSTGTATPTSSTTSTATATSTGAPFSGNGYLNVVTGGSQNGCIISKGTWYTSGTCATFKASASGSSFTLSSSKGDCAVDSSGALACGSSVGSATSFSADGTKLVYNGQDTFYADSVPSGSTQATVYLDGQSSGTSLSLEWQST